MSFKITVEEIVVKGKQRSLFLPEAENTSGSKGAYADCYVEEETNISIYEQTVKDLDLKAVIGAVNAN